MLETYTKELCWFLAKRNPSSSSSMCSVLPNVRTPDRKALFLVIAALWLWGWIAVIFKVLQKRIFCSIKSPPQKLLRKGISGFVYVNFFIKVSVLGEHFFVCLVFHFVLFCFCNKALWPKATLRGKGIFIWLTLRDNNPSLREVRVGTQQQPQRKTAYRFDIWLAHLVFLYSADLYT